MKKIAYIMNAFPVLSETFIGTEMRAMQQQGHAIIPIALQPNQQPHQPIDDALADMTQHLTDVTDLQACYTLFRQWRHLSTAFKFIWQQQGLGKLSLLLNGARLAYLIQRCGANHLHAHFALGNASLAIVAARIAGCTVSLVGHGHDIYAHPVDLGLKLDATDLNIAVCQQMLDDFQQLQPHHPHALVYCGVDPNRFQGQGADPNSQRLLFIGRLCEKKGLDHLLYALARLPCAVRPSLDIVGQGPLEPALHKQIQQLHLSQHVQLLGAKPAEWFIQHHMQYAALVAPCRQARNGDRDTGPIVIKEAMALGMPVITTAFMGCQDMVDACSGITVEPGSITALAQGIEAFFQLSATQRQAMQQHARKRVIQYFSASAQATKFSQLIEALTPCLHA